MGFGKGMVTSSEINAHKKMAGADSKGTFGVGKVPTRHATHPDASMSHAPMSDAARGPGLSGKGVNMQAAPDHGGYGVDHFSRGGKA